MLEFTLSLSPRAAHLACNRGMLAHLLSCRGLCVAFGSVLFLFTTSFTGLDSNFAICILTFDFEILSDFGEIFHACSYFLYCSIMNLYN